MILLVLFTLLLIHFFLFLFLRWKQRFLTQNVYLFAFGTSSTKFLQKFAIMFLLLPFTLLLIQISPVYIFKVKNSVFWPKTCISSHLEHVQPNFAKIANNVLVGTLYTSADTVFPVYIFKVKNSVSFDPKLVFLPVWNMFDQNTSNYAIMFLFVLFILLLIQFYPISILRWKTTFLHRKLYLFPFGTCSTKLLQTMQSCFCPYPLYFC